MNDFTCPVCKTVVGPTNIAYPTHDKMQVACPNCGQYQLPRLVELRARPLLRDSPEFSAILAHYIRRMQRNDEWPLVGAEVIERIEKEGRLPDPTDQANNLVLWVGKTQRHPGEMIPLDYDNSRAVIGAVDRDGVMFIAESLRDQGLVQFPDPAIGEGAIRLTFEGWQRHHDLTRRSSAGPRAFMAMQYNNTILDERVFPKFKSETKAAGFDLVKLTDVSRAGSIDEQLRVEIRRARFLVADLTHDNAGSYWEAGFAEGLGKPVIYTCERGIFESRGTHFDTNHYHTILWDADDPVKAARDLKATIRATLPDEAQMDD